MEQLAKLAHTTDIGWSKNTVDIVANIAWAIKKGDRKRVRLLLPMLAQETAQGMVNEIQSWSGGGVVEGWREVEAARRARLAAHFKHWPGYESLSAMDTRALAHVSLNSGVTTEVMIAQDLGLAFETVGRAVKKLIAQGLIARSADGKGLELSRDEMQRQHAAKVDE